MAQNYTNALPDNAIACNGPLMYDLNRHITPDGKLFHVHPTTNRIKEIRISKQKQWAWGSAKQKLPDDTIIDMPSIDGFYECKNGRATPTALLAYYFIEKINPVGMRGIVIDPNGPLRVNNIRWGTKKEQDTARLNAIRPMVNPENIYKIVDNVIIEEYTQWKDSNYFVKNDGSRVIKSMDNAYKEINIYTGSDGYHSITAHINGTPKVIRMNRLMAAIHHRLDLDSDLVIDHVDGNILNNHPNNLQIVSIQENTRRGNSACPIIKVDPNTMRVVEEIRCIQEYVDEHPEYSLKTIRRIKNTNEQFNNFYWLNKQLENILYVIEDNKIRFLQMDINHVVEYILGKIQEYHSDNVINPEILPIDENGLIEHTDEIINLVNELDPRGLGREDDIEKYQRIISGHLPCCRLVSYHGNVANPQIVICLKTMLIFTRSIDNLNQVSRKCPLCICNRGNNRQMFKPTDPEMNIPIYSFNAIGGKRSNGDPLAFHNSYSTVYDAIKEDYSPSKLKSIRQSLFGLTNESTKHWIDQTKKLDRTKNFPKRVLSMDLYWSFYPPIDGYLSETHPDWLLERRLNCATVQCLRDAVINRKV